MAELKAITGTDPADCGRARSWLAPYRRVQSIGLARTSGQWRATVHGVGHRRPASGSIPLDVAFRLAEWGVPVRIVRRHRPAALPGGVERER